MSRGGIAVIGCGYWGPNLIRNFIKLVTVDNVHCVDVDVKRLETMRTMFSRNQLSHRCRGGSR